MWREKKNAIGMFLGKMQRFAWCCIVLHYVALHGMAWHCIALCCVALCCVSYIVMHCCILLYLFDSAVVVRAFPFFPSVFFFCAD